MSQAEFSHILDALKEQTQYIYYHLMGEPLTHPDLPKFMRMAGERGYRSIITTNGTLLKKRGAELIAAGMHKINISLHSFEDGEHSDYEHYIGQVAEFADTAAKAGVIVVLRLWNRGCDGGRNDSTLKLLRSHLDGDWAENTRGLRIRERLFVEWGDRFEWPDPEAPVQGERVFCYGLGDHFGILSDGSVVPCCLDSDAVITLGNIFTQSIEDILQSPRARAMVKGFEGRTATEELCRRCGYAQRFV